MDVREAYKFMKGESVFPANPNKKNVTITQDEMKNYLNIAFSLQGMKESIDTINTPKVFYEVHPYFARLVQKAHKEEVFYAIKCGSYSPEIPSKIIYAAQRAKEDGAINNFITQFTKAEIDTIFTEGYLAEGYTMYDAVCSVVGHFELIAEWKLVVRAQEDGFSEMYIPSAKYVAVLPTEIACRFTASDLEHIEVKKGTLTINGTPILYLGDYIGVASGIYDLRDAR